MTWFLPGWFRGWRPERGQVWAGWLICSLALAAASSHGEVNTNAPAPILPPKVRPHANLGCKECHETSLGPEVRGYAQKTSGRAVFKPLPEGIQLEERHWQAIYLRCENCHKEVFAEWKSSAHAQTFAEAYLNRAHNRVEQPHSDCLRCHGALFTGRIEDIVAPLEVEGPWKLVRPELSSRPVMPCLVCHHIHRETAAPVWDPSVKKNLTDAERDTGFFDHRERLFFPLASLPSPQIQVENRAIRLTSDLAPRNCYQCHAPQATHQAGTSDDRTPRGVHEGLGCLDCHANHSLRSRQSCAQCHPAVSHCGLDVTRLDTTYRSRASRNNIHFVSCADCHPAGVPVKK